jgi:hypothetical protein
MIGPTDLLHPSPAPHFETIQVFLIYGPKRPSFMLYGRIILKKVFKNCPGGIDGIGLAQDGYA